MAAAIITSFIPVIDTDGTPINGAKLYVAEAGSSTLKDIFTNAALSTPAANPIVTNARGMHAIRYVAAGTYKIVAKQSDSTLISNGTDITDYSWDNIDTGVAVGSGSLAVASGGTGAANAAGARTNLAAASAAEVASLAADVSSLEDSLTGTDATQLAAGTTAQRPGSPADGQVRFNSTTGEYEGYDATWKKIGMEGSIDHTYFAASSGLICLQRSFTSITTTGGVSSSIPNDGTIPQIGEGGEIASVVFTPAHASSTIRITANIVGTNGSTGEVVIALFQNSGANAIAATRLGQVAKDEVLPFHHEVALGSVTPVTFSLRIGVTTGTFTMNGGAVNTLGGLVKSNFIIEEWITK